MQVSIKIFQYTSICFNCYWQLSLHNIFHKLLIRSIVNWCTEAKKQTNKQRQSMKNLFAQAQLLLNLMTHLNSHYGYIGLECYHIGGMDNLNSNAPSCQQHLIFMLIHLCTGWRQSPGFWLAQDWGTCEAAPHFRFLHDAMSTMN